MTHDEDPSTNETRRTFIKTAGIATTGLFAFSGSAAAHGKDDGNGGRDIGGGRGDSGDGRRDGGNAEASNDADIDNEIEQEQSVEQNSEQNGAAIAFDGDAEVEQESEQEAEQEQAAANINDIQQDAFAAALHDGGNGGPGTPPPTSGDNG